MPVILVVDKNDAFLPRGWISAVLPDGKTPTDYEREAGPWKVMSVPDSAGLCPQREPGVPSLLPRALVLEYGDIKEVPRPAHLLAARLASPAALKKFGGPETLDRSHSTVWDYGPDRTYSTPQAAFDALLLQEGAAPFTETHYIRGWWGEYGQGPSGFSLHLTTVAPNRTFPLVVDAAPGGEVVMNGEAGDAVLVGEGVDHVAISSLRLSNAYFGIVPADPNVGGALTKDWTVNDCVIDQSRGVLSVGISTINTDRLRVRETMVDGIAQTAVGGVEGLASDYSCRAEVSGCLLAATYQALMSECDMDWILAGNTVVSRRLVRHIGTRPLTITAMLNNVFRGIMANRYALDLPDLLPDSLRVGRSDGNVFYPATAGNMAYVGGTAMDLPAWQDMTGEDKRSVEADPMLDADNVPRYGSPCLGAGVCWHAEGRSGTRRALSIDAGFEQVTPPREPRIGPRTKPEIRRRK